MRCPTCRRETFFEGNPYRPFCSERCKLIDLDNWLSERYRIPACPETDDSSAPATAPPVSDKGDCD